MRLFDTLIFGAIMLGAVLLLLKACEPVIVVGACETAPVWEECKARSRLEGP